MLVQQSDRSLLSVPGYCVPDSDGDKSMEVKNGSVFQMILRLGW